MTAQESPPPPPLPCNNSNSGGPAQTEDQPKRKREETALKLGYFSAYFENLFIENPRSLFYPWDIDRILREKKLWTLPTLLHIYVLANDCSFRTLHAHVGCAYNLEERVQQHNKERPGGPPETRKAAGHWTHIMHVDIPPIRNFSTKELKWNTKRGRGWISRCKRAITLAEERRLDWRINAIIQDSQSPYYAPTLVEYIENTNNRARPASVYFHAVVPPSSSQDPIAPLRKKKRKIKT